MSVASIRDTMSSTVIALTPSTLTGHRFKQHRLHRNFRDFAETTPAGVFRTFSIRDTGETDGPEVTNTDVEWVWTTMICEIAYANDFRGGPQMALDRDDLIESDLRQINDAIGTNGYATIEGAGAGTVTTIGTFREEEAACTYGVIRMRVGFYRAMP